jgi:hypothetical protein
MPGSDLAAVVGFSTAALSGSLHASIAHCELCDAARAVGSTALRPGGLREPASEPRMNRALVVLPNTFLVPILRVSVVHAALPSHAPLPAAHAFAVDPSTDVAPRCMAMLRPVPAITLRCRRR